LGSEGVDFAGGRIEERLPQEAGVTEPNQVAAPGDGQGGADAYLHPVLPKTR
jgi:hypothetical protein